jgi:hypothetical protein
LRFQFWPHPSTWMENEKGECIIDSLKNILEDIHVNLTLSTSKWLERFKEETVDYLLENTL